MYNEDKSLEVKECCKVAVDAYRRERAQKNARAHSFESSAIMIVLAIGIPLTFIFHPPLVWQYMDSFMVALSIFSWLALILEFRKWMKVRQSKTAS